MTTTTDDRRLFDTAGRPIRIPGDEARPDPLDPAAATSMVGRSRFTARLDALCGPDLDAPGPQRHPNHRTVAFATVRPVRGLLVAYDRTGAIVTPLAARLLGRGTYSRLSERRAVVEVDEALYEAAWNDNTRLRLELDRALGDLVRERTYRQTVEMQRDRAVAERDALRSELDAARKRVGELELTVKALGKLVQHAAGHDKTGTAASGTEGGE